jgi:hypothetical protein
VRLDTRSRQEIIKADGEEYRAAGKKGRGEILNRPVLVTRLNRGRLAARLRNCGKDGAAEAGGEAGKGKRKARPPGGSAEAVRKSTGSGLRGFPGQYSGNTGACAGSC